MPGQWFTPSGEYIPPYFSRHKRYYAITDAMYAEHDWLTAGTASYKLASDKISDYFVEIYIKILNFGKISRITLHKLYGLTF